MAQRKASKKSSSSTKPRRSQDTLAAQASSSPQQRPQEFQEGDSVTRWNFEDAEELRATMVPAEPPDLSVFSRDWTVETIVRQIELFNIDLDPDFQRRNAWQDDRRSLLIESLIHGFPVPQIVLAEHPHQRKAYIVIDGKQRLLTIAGFYLQRFRDYWKEPKLRGLKARPQLNGRTIEEILTLPEFKEELRLLGNADLRATVISDYHDENVLYDIFYRLNTGSVPLSSQELRQVIYRGDFSKHLARLTSADNPLRRVLKIDAPDPRFRDVELLLRALSFVLYPHEYKGNLRPFLDEAVKALNGRWASDQDRITSVINDIMLAVDALLTAFGNSVGRKYNGALYESQINRAVFEVQVYFLRLDTVRSAFLAKHKVVVAAFEHLCANNVEFLTSIESTTKSVENYRIRFRLYREMLQAALHCDIPAFPL